MNFCPIHFMTVPLSTTETGDITSSTRPNSLEKDLTHLSSVHFTYFPIKTRDVGLTLKPLPSKKLRRKWTKNANNWNFSKSRSINLLKIARSYLKSNLAYILIKYIGILRTYPSYINICVIKWPVVCWLIWYITCAKTPRRKQVLDENLFLHTWTRSLKIRTSWSDVTLVTRR